jgi:hypothetical protein
MTENTPRLQHSPRLVHFVSPSMACLQDENRLCKQRYTRMNNPLVLVLVVPWLVRVLKASVFNIQKGLPVFMCSATNPKASEEKKVACAQEPRGQFGSTHSVKLYPALPLFFGDGPIFVAALTKKQSVPLLENESM